MLSGRRTCISVLINAVLLLSTSTLQSVSFCMKTFWITAFVLCVCMYVYISPLRQGQQCFTTDRCLQLLSCQSFSHDVSCNTFWKLLIIWHWVWTKFFFLLLLLPCNSSSFCKAGLHFKLLPRRRKGVILPILCCKDLCASDKSSAAAVPQRGGSSSTDAVWARRVVHSAVLVARGTSQEKLLLDLGLDRAAHP